MTWRIDGSAESGFGTLDVPGRLWQTSGAIFTGFNPVANKTGISGFLFIPGAWSSSGADEYCSLTDCLTDSSRCPVSTGGHPNALVLYANGMEDSGCPNPNPCDANWRIRLSGAPVDGLPNLFIGRAGAGYDQVNLSLGAPGQSCPPPLLQPNVEYSLDQISRHVGFTYPFDAQSHVKLRLGSPEPGRSGGLPCWSRLSTLVGPAATARLDRTLL